MNRISRIDWARIWLSDASRSRGLSAKAISFAAIGIVNTLVDYGVFCWRGRS